MLAVGIEATDQLVAVLGRVAVAGGDRRAKTPVLAEREHLGACLPRDPGRPVGRAVVDHEDVDVGQDALQLLEHLREVLGLVPGRDEDQRAAQCSRLRQALTEAGNQLGSLRRAVLRASWSASPACSPWMPSPWPQRM